LVLTDPSVWGPVLVAASVLWAASWITQAIQTAEAARRQDHEFLTRDLAEIASDIGQLTLLVGGISNKVDPPPTVFEDPPY
jgi:hypothetical protein